MHLLSVVPLSSSSSSSISPYPPPSPLHPTLHPHTTTTTTSSSSSSSSASVCATCFLWGPWTQAKAMFSESRVVATSIYFLFIGITLFLAFYPGYIPVRLLWLILSILLQFIALCWYTLSGIPYARDIVKACMRESCVKRCCPDNTPSDPYWG